MSGVVRFPKTKRERKPARTLSCPAHVQGEARVEWRRIVAETRTARILAPENRALLEAYCLAYGRWRAAEAHLATHGPVVPAPRTGVPMYSPLYTIATRERDALLRLADALGLTPKARGRVEAAKEAGGDGWDGLLA